MWQKRRPCAYKNAIVKNTCVFAIFDPGKYDQKKLFFIRKVISNERRFERPFVLDFWPPGTGL